MTAESNGGWIGQSLPRSLKHSTRPSGAAGGATRLATPPAPAPREESPPLTRAFSVASSSSSAASRLRIAAVSALSGWARAQEARAQPLSSARTRRIRLRTQRTLRGCTRPSQSTHPGPAPAPPRRVASPRADGIGGRELSTNVERPRLPRVPAAVGNYRSSRIGERWMIVDTEDLSNIDACEDLSWMRCWLAGAGRELSRRC